MKGVRSQDAQQFVIYIIPTVIKHTSMFLDGPPSPEEPNFVLKVLDLWPHMGPRLVAT